MSDTPVGHGFLNMLDEATTNAPPCVKNIVAKMIQSPSFKEQLEYYEITNHGMSRDIVIAAVGAAHWHRGSVHGNAARWEAHAAY